MFVDNMAEQRTLRQLTAHDVNYNGVCIDYLAADTPTKLKSDLIHLLSKLNSLTREDLHNLKEFQVVCSAPSEPSLEDIVKQMAANNLKYE